MGLYVHVPFCVHKCGYCDFNSWAEERIEPQHAWVKALERQTAFWSPRLSEHEFSTVFFGGGTPSLLEDSLIEQTMSLLRSRFRFSKNVEITWEMNPETLTEAKLETFDRSGVNRLSMGVQSFQNVNLDRLERRARREDNFRALELLGAKWPYRWSLDLMFALPRQTLETWAVELSEALQFHPKHISAYQLTLTTERSKNWEQAGEDELLKFLLFTQKQLHQAGLPFYEISNFAVPGEECRHNLKYWQLKGFLGLGPGAAGLIPGRWLGAGRADPDRWGFHQKNPDRFEKWSDGAGLESAELDGWLKPRDWKAHLEELLMMSLRLRQGVDSSRLGRFSSLLQGPEFAKNGSLVALTESALPLLNSHLQNIFAKIDEIQPQSLDLEHLDPKF